MRTLVANVVRLKCGVLGQFTLYGEGPLLNIRVMGMLGDDHSKELAAVRRRTDLV